MCWYSANQDDGVLMLISRHENTNHNEKGIVDKQILCYTS